MAYKSGEFQFNLTSPLRYSVGGDPAKEAVFITLKEPRAEHDGQYFKLKQMVSQALISAAGSLADFASDETPSTLGVPVSPDHEKSDEELDKEDEGLPEMISMALQLSDKVDLAVFMKTFKTMAVKNTDYPVCLVDGKTPMTSNLYDRLNRSEALALACAWCSFFADALASPEKPESRQQST